MQPRTIISKYKIFLKKEDDIIFKLFWNGTRPQKEVLQPTTKNRNNCCDTDFNILIYQYLIGPRSLKIPIKITVTEEGRKTN